MSDEREGLPSASGLERIALCRGSWNAERLIPRKTKDDGLMQEENEDANIGTRIHAFLAGQPTTLSEDEADLARRCAKIETASLPDADARFVLREQRLWMVEGGRRIASGQADAIHAYSNEAFVFDYKTGRNEVSASDVNLQLRCLAVLTSERVPSADIVVVGIIQPWASGESVTCVYSRSDIAKAREQIIALLAEAENPNAPRVAGEEQCRHCRAKANCPELASVALTLAAQSESGALDASRLPQLLEACATADKYIVAIRKAARELLKSDPAAVKGWRLKDGAAIETITDPQGVFARWRAMGFSSESFMSAVEIGKGKLTLSLKNNSGATGRALEEEFAVLTAGLTETKQNAPSLARVKKD